MLDVGDYALLAGIAITGAGMLIWWITYWHLPDFQLPIADCDCFKLAIGIGN
jgi:hypothetical protein